VIRYIGAESFYVASGGSDDWAHRNNVPIVFTIELRDRGTYGFAMPESELKETCEENIAGIETVYNHIKPTNSCQCKSSVTPEYDYETNKFICSDEGNMEKIIKLKSHPKKSFLRKYKFS
jgi:hypothetical protein